MDSVATGFFELLKVAVLNEKFFVTISLIILLILSMAIYFLIVLNINRNIAHKRKAIGMVAVEQSIKMIQNTMVNHYYKLAEMYDKDNWYYSLESDHQKYMIDDALGYRRDRFRERIRMNGFEDKKDYEWNDYKKDSIAEDFNAITLFMNEKYHPKAVIPRHHTKETKEKYKKLPDLAEWNKQILPEIKDELVELLDGLRSTAKKNRFLRFFGWRVMFGVY